MEYFFLTIEIEWAYLRQNRRDDRNRFWTFSCGITQTFILNRQQLKSKIIQRSFKRQAYYQSYLESYWLLHCPCSLSVLLKYSVATRSLRWRLMVKIFPKACQNKTKKISLNIHMQYKIMIQSIGWWRQLINSTNLIYKAQTINSPLARFLKKVFKIETWNLFHSMGNTL